MYIKQQMSESLLVAALLAIVGGYLDAYSYIARGQVFANAQTGNIVLLGYYVAHGQVRIAFLYFIPICSFAIGVFVTEYIKSKYKTHPKFHWRQGIIILEVFFILIIAYLPEGNWNILANTMISFICAMQVEAFRKVKGDAYASTMCTGNLRSGSEQLFRWFFYHDEKAKQKSFRYIVIIACFTIGAIIGVFITIRLDEKAISLCSLLLLLIFILMFVQIGKDPKNAITK
ncbi:YoaK family protein [Sinanaerobacter chloroacetimidivorans]|uniref:DUF1275 domain-containing protein n=1 Tax=Sinanaerobacter chloroacetimidivorans TaxID=2818044 RepID=A0A8J7VYC0_9FIRM|nr:YoaK family protein [Sinanaerobacter chloroacetimidivorans]MBR0597314.1 DUF1275 domain-containing protein [Sinanaerobacter chloroacetimidivorans]